MRNFVALALVAGCLGLILVACGENPPTPPSQKGDDKPLLQQLDKPVSGQEARDQDETKGETQLALLADKLASSSSDLAAQAQQAPFGVAAVPDAYADDVNSFAVLAMSASQALKASGGPADLACIFHGMSADARATLSRLQDADKKADQVKDYDRMVALFQDVIDVQNGTGSQQWNGETCKSE